MAAILRSKVVSLSRKKTNIVLLSVFVLTFFLFFLNLKYEKNQILYSSFPKEDYPFPIVSAHYVEQEFELKGEYEGFNGISMAIFNPSDQDIPCSFFLKTSKGGRIIQRRELLIKKGTDKFSTVRASFPHVSLALRNKFCLELRATVAFWLIVFTTEAVEGSFPASINRQDSFRQILFRVEHRENRSIFSTFTRPEKLRKPLACILLILGSLFFFGTAAFLFYRSFSCVSTAKETASPTHKTIKLHIAVLICLALFLVLFLSMAFVLQNNTHARLLGAEDDAYITYKYARNIIKGEGFSFNPDEKILGTTTPLYTLILSMFGSLTQRLDIVSLVLNVLSILLSGIVVYLLFLRHVPAHLALASGLLFIYFPVFYRILGMETNLSIFLVLLCLYLFVKTKYGLAFFVLGLATLMRMELCILFLLLALIMIWKKEFRKLLKACAVYLLAILPWFVFSYLSFGSLVPNTFYIKTGGTYAETGIFPKVHHLFLETLRLVFFKSMFLKSFSFYLADSIQNYFVWVSLFFLCLLFSLKKFFTTNYLRIYFFFVLLFIFALSVLNVSPYIWYYGLPFSLVPLTVALGFSRISLFFKKRLGSPKTVPLAGLILLALLIFEMKSIHDIFFGYWLSQHTGHVERYETYLEIGRYINEQIPPEKTIAMEEIGIVGYMIPNKIWDFHLLIHDGREFPNPFDATKAERYIHFMHMMNPDLAILNSGRWAQTSFYRQNFRIVRLFPVSEFPWDPLFYYLLLEKKAESF